MKTEKCQQETNEILQAIKKLHNEFCNLNSNLEIHHNLEVMKIWFMICKRPEDLLELKWKCGEQSNILFHRREFIAAEKFENLLLLINEKREKFYEKEKAEIMIFPRLKKFFKKIIGSC